MKQLHTLVTGMAAVGVVAIIAGLVVGFAAGNWLVASAVLGGGYAMAVGGWLSRRRLRTMLAMTTRQEDQQ